jgi:hypothetical protein
MSLLAIGTQTHWGEIVAVQWVGERYYFIMDQLGGVSMMPSDIVEQSATSQEGQHESR